MKTTIRGIASVFVLLSIMAPTGAAADDSTKAFRQLERDSVTIDLQFTKKGRNAVERAMTFLFDYGPNGNATGFVVGNGLVMTAYHVVSGDLSVTKKAMLGFKPDDVLEARAYINGSRATVVSIDQDADLALLRITSVAKDGRHPAFQTNLNKDEKLLLIARPNGGKQVRRGVLFGKYNFHGLDYWSMKMDSRDGFSGSPVYNEKAEVVGLFSGYDWAQKLAVVSPAGRAQKLLDDYAASPQP